jgi:peptidoglycan hydrolase-like protein with peptidoglycan-binding domain
MKKLPFLVAFLVVGAGGANADEQTRRIQEELRARHFYFGEIDGQRTEATRRALQHYQEKKGLKATGVADADTLSRLSLSDSAPTGTTWPDVPVLKSDQARKFRDEDRKYLESLDPEPVAEGSDVDVGPPTEESAPPRSTKPPGKKPAPPLTNRERAPDRESQRPPQKESLPAAERESRPPADQESRPAERETRPAAERENESSIPADRAERFMREYLDACETNKPARESAYYAKKVKYFDYGVVDRQFVDRDVAAYRKHWPERQYELLDFKLLSSSEDRATVKFRLSFHYRNSKHTVSGKTDNVYTIAKAGDEMKITSLREQRIRE